MSKRIIYGLYNEARRRVPGLLESNSIGRSNLDQSSTNTSVDYCTFDNDFFFLESLGSKLFSLTTTTCSGLEWRTLMCTGAYRE